MPIIIVKRDQLFENLGKQYSEEEFRNLCFEYGIELDDITSEKEMKENELNRKIEDEELSEEVLYKIEIPANRYDLLCEEGLTNALLIFLKKMKIPKYEYTLDPKSDNLVTMTVKKETSPLRPFIVCAILRNIKFNEHTFKFNFLSLQDKLHQNIGRRRTIVAIGTHDLDKIEGPFTYEGKAPESIEFVPLDKTKSFRADHLMEFYETDPSHKHLKPYVPIIKDSPYYPVIYDKNGVVLSLPPIINGNHSKMSASTRNVLIEITCTDRNKGLITLNSMISAFSQYCEKKFTVEPVKVIYENGEVDITPRLKQEVFTVSLKKIKRVVGIDIDQKECAAFLERMGHETDIVDDDLMKVTVPIYRADVLHECDIIEDVAIAYGYNRIQVTQPKGRTVGKEDPFNKLCDQLRIEMAICGYIEMYTLSLVSKEENFTMMCKEIPEKQFVELGNAKAENQFQMVRTSMIPCLLNAVHHNQKKLSLPMKFFEINDVCELTKETDTGSINSRRLVLMYAGTKSILEEVHGVMDRAMKMMEVPFGEEQGGYHLVPEEDSSFFEKRHANIIYKGEKAGDIGVIHPQVLKNFKIDVPVVVCEIWLERFREDTKIKGIFLKDL